MNYLKIILAIIFFSLFACTQNDDGNNSAPQQSKEFMELQKKKAEKQKELEKLKEEIQKLKSKKDSLKTAEDSI